jgi:hypothetical protein
VSKRAGSVLALVIALTHVVGTAPDFEALGREVVTELSTGAFERVVARFDEKMVAALPREKLEAAWDMVVDKMGAFKSVTTVRIREAPANKAYHLAELDCAFEQGPVGIRLAFNEEQKIAGLFFVPIKPPVAELRRHVDTKKRGEYERRRILFRRTPRSAPPRLRVEMAL